MSTPRPYDPFARDCPSRRLLDRIGDRWTVLLITTLEDGPRRFSELLHTVDGISQKMLTQTLRSLEADGLVLRTVHPEIPPRVEYELTELGRSLLEPLGALISWATDHMGEVQTSRDAVSATA
ncbi:HxlR family transcriptional regulator [Brachybacterium sp. HMSC06H03]|uniref:winged helix-turn-helix transcriptional regulator n=1 Tax=Brachybacterium sp. HMSC06H03 TaxID=1581127 RepID=UPI0008A12DBF|nr:helix-turn-helix domain-containing protein [Brachybacterium sp. HMSC06H03]OFT44038.1 HxlR family transcriptional regulator [Brachybacterium sp. HMSC06H03]